MRKAKDIIFIIIGLLIITVMVLYAKEGRLSFTTLKDDFLEALNLKKARVEERLNYNPVTYQELISTLKNKGLVVGDPIELGTNTLGAKIAVKFNVEGKNIYFYIIDFDNDKDENILNTKKSLEEKGQVYIEGKWYNALTNQTALIAKYDDNPKKDVIVDVFNNIVGLSYDEMISERTDNSLNPTVTTIDKILDNFEEATK